MKVNTKMAEKPYTAPNFETVWLASEAFCLSGSDYGTTGAAGGYNSGNDLEYGNEF